MYHGYRRLVCSLVCVFSILSMLFLDTCTVKAAAITSSTSISGTVTADTCEVSWIGGSTGYLSNGTGSIGLSGGVYQASVGFYHFEIPITIKHNWASFNNGYDRPNFETGYVQYDFGVSSIIVSGNCTVENYYVRDKEGNIVTDLYGVEKTNKVFENYTANSNTKLTYYVCGDAYFTDKGNKTSLNYDSVLSKNFTLTINYYLNVRKATDQQIENSIPSVSESHSENIESNTESTAENTSGILSKITDFFGSFFENLIGIFVPEDGYFSGWFDRVNTLLSEKLGMLYAPFDLVISTLQAIYSSSTTESGIPFPGIKWEDTWLVEPFTFTFASLGSSFDDFRDKVYFATDTVLVLTFLMLLQSKVKLILEGHE